MSSESRIDSYALFGKKTRKNGGMKTSVKKYEVILNVYEKKIKGILTLVTFFAPENSKRKTEEMR